MKGQKGMAMFSRDDAQAALAQNFAPWVQALDLTVTEVSAEGVVMQMPITADLARVGGIVSGQALMAAADTAMVLAAAAQAQAFQMVATTDLHSQFLRPGSGEAIEIKARVVRAGRSMVFAQADLVAQPSGKLCATATATMARS